MLRALFTEFTVLAEKKIERLLKEPLVSFIDKLIKFRPLAIEKHIVMDV